MYYIELSRRVTILPLFCLFLLLPIKAGAQTETVIQWNFDQKEHWTGASCLHDVKVENGLYRAVASGKGPFLFASGFEFPTTKSQALEIRYRTNRKGKGDLFFTNTTEGPFGGFSEEKSVPWPVLGDEKWHVARILPGWNAEKKIVKLRIDFPDLVTEETGGVFYEIDWIRVVDLNFDKAQKVENPVWNFSAGANSAWQTTDGGTLETLPMRLDVDENSPWLSIEMAADRGEFGTIRFYNNQGKRDTLTFRLNPDGKTRWYNIVASKSNLWRGTIQHMELIPSNDPAAKMTVKRIAVSEKPQGSAEIAVEQAWQTDAINRVGKPSTLAVRLRNDGGEIARNVAISVKELPPGVSVVKQAKPVDIGPVEVGTVTLELSSDKTVDGIIKLETPSGVIGTKVRFDADLNLPKTDYVPKPIPLKSDYEIGALYYPGWARRDKWDRIEGTHPERKPVLGWYDEANPEVIDWQIKWSLENGIQYYLVDWYWHKGNQHNDHWVKGFYKTRYKSMFRWAMMWANHNAAGSHSEEDQRAVTKFWIENYFNTPEYYTKDGKPVVMIWSPQNMDRDVIEVERKKGNTLKKGEGVKRLLDISRSMAKEAGLPGICFIAMKWPEASTQASDIQWLAAVGFDMTSLYHFMHHGGKAKDPMRFDFQLVVDANLPYLESRQETGILPFLPNISTGWDSRPWHGNRKTIIENRTVKGFRTICRDVKAFADRNGHRNLMLAPTNEWGEGSYAEPNAEYGFGMFETIREIFCEKPVEGWPVNYAPGDVGLGPYDLPPTPLSRTNWDFQYGAQGWYPLVGAADFKAGSGKMSFRASTKDPVLVVSLRKIQASDFGRLIVRMKVSGGEKATDSAQLFWSTETSSVSETNSLRVPVKADGKSHDYVFDLKSKKQWRGTLTSLRFDPVGTPGKSVEIESIRLMK